jgi:hypothetical protein
MLVCFLGFRPGLGLAGITHSFDAAAIRKDELDDDDDFGEMNVRCAHKTGEDGERISGDNIMADCGWLR